MGEHLLIGGWPLLRALRVDAEMTKRRVSESEQACNNFCFFCSFLGRTAFGVQFVEHGSVPRWTLRGAEQISETVNGCIAVGWVAQDCHWTPYCK